MDALVTRNAPRTFYVPATRDGIVCGLCTSACGIEVRHASVDEVALCAMLRWDAMEIAEDAPIPAWLLAAI